MCLCIVFQNDLSIESAFAAAEQTEEIKYDNFRIIYVSPYLSIILQIIYPCQLSIFIVFIHIK